MDQLKPFFPFSFRAQKGDVVSLIISIVIYLVIGAVGGLLIGLLSGIPVIGILAVLAGALLDIYGLVGIVLAVLSFLEIVK